MKRSTPLKRRTPLRAKPRPPRPAKQIDYTPTPRTPAPSLSALRGLVKMPSGETSESIVERARAGWGAPKRDYVRSPALLAACRLIQCQHCGAHDGTVCAAHSNWACHGKGRGIKADDNRVAALCSACHHELDQGSKLNRVQRLTLWWGAHVRTVREMLRLKLWPAGAPIPDLLEEPNP